VAQLRDRYDDDDDDDDGAKQAIIASKRKVAKILLLAFPRMSVRIRTLKYHRTDLAYEFRYSGILLIFIDPFQVFITIWQSAWDKGKYIKSFDGEI